MQSKGGKQGNSYSWMLGPDFREAMAVMPGMGSVRSGRASGKLQPHRQTMHTDDKEYLAYTIPRLTVSEETEKYYIIPVIWDFLVDKQTGRVLVYYNGLDPFAYVFDPMAEGALAFAG